MFVCRPSQTDSTAGAVAASSSMAASTRPAGAPLSIADRLEVAARYSSSSMVDSLTALGSWARVFNQTHRAKATASPSTTGDKCMYDGHSILKRSLFVCMYIR